MSKHSLVDALLSQMTLEEKVGQLNLAPDADAVDVDQIRSGKTGAVICATSAYAGNDRQTRVRADRINELQKVATEGSRLGIPLLVGRDVIHGHRTVAPIPLGQACSWSLEDVENCATIASQEAQADGIRWMYTPMLDIARDPRWGRVAEGYGEDPFLAAKLGAAAVRGLQRANGERLEMAACAKHFAGYGAVEGGRDYNSGEIGPFTMRNIYLPPFKAAVEAGVASIMTCFNDLGAVPVTANPALVTGVLKGDWGFNGFTVSDWGAVGELMMHGVAASESDAARLAMTAGIDMDMASDCYANTLACLVKEGEVPIEAIDESVRRVLRVKQRLGLFESPFASDAKSVSSSAHQSTLALNRKSVVMLKNNGILPLKSQGRIGLFGPFIEEKAALLGTWCLDGETSDVVSMREACEQEFGCNRLLLSDLPDKSIDMARHCEVGVVCVGESAARTGEANSIAGLDLPAGQLELLQGLKRVGVPVVAVIFAGRPLDLSWLDENVDAILYVFHPGLFGSIAVAEILSGRTSPSGRLPITFPRSVGQIPIYYNHRPTGRPLDPYVRGDSRYLDLLDSPLYPFGFGLTFGEVSYENLEVSSAKEGIGVRCSIRNKGASACDEVVQAYIRDRLSCAARPVKELKAFERISLQAGQTREVSFELSEDALGYFGPDEKWRFEPGDFEVWVGPNAREGPSERATIL